MANYINHPRQRKRTDEYFKLEQNTLNQLYQLPTMTTINISRASQSITATRTPGSLMIHLNNTHGYHIRFDSTLLTYGQRQWYVCPSCNRRCAILYLKGYFACRLCVKPAYRSQNGSKTDARMDSIRAKRKKLWPDMPSWWRDDLLESSLYWPKPKQRHNAKFEKDRNKLATIESSHHKKILKLRTS